MNASREPLRDEPAGRGPSAGSRKAAPTAPRRILLLDDNDDDVELLRRRLVDFGRGVEVRACSTLGQARREVAAGVFDCLLIDYQLGEIDGVEALSELRREGCDAAAIVLSGCGDEQVAVKAIQHGAQDYLVKEKATSGALRRAIGNAVEKAALERRVAEQRRELEDFVSVVAHDLQQPLCATKGNVELLRDYYSDCLDEHGREFAQAAIQTSDRMFEMLQGLLAYARVGRSSSCKMALDASECVRGALSNLSKLIDETDATVETGELPLVLGDEMSLVQLFQNLIANAVKFHSGRPPEVRISAEEQDGGWRISVADRGIGIDSQSFEEIFSPFRRLPTRQRFRGAGVGLATCRRIVADHGGRIWVESTPGEGSTFHVWLPAAGGVESEQSAACEGAVLLVDDDLAAFGSLARRLEQAGFEVLATDDPHEAAEALGERTWTAVVTDLVMPGLSGADLIERARRLQPEALLIAVSGGGPRDSPGRLLAEAKRLGADRLYPKPIRAAALATAIQSARRPSNRLNRGRS